MKVNPREQTQQLAKSSQFVGNSWEEEDHFHAAHREDITRSMVYIIILLGIGTECPRNLINFYIVRILITNKWARLL